VLIAVVVATHVANAVLSMVLVVAYSLLAVGPQGHPDGGSVDRFASLFSTWPIPVLTLWQRFGQPAGHDRS
jgi:hypothetical protein